MEVNWNRNWLCVRVRVAADFSHQHGWRETFQLQSQNPYARSVALFATKITEKKEKKKESPTKSEWDHVRLSCSFCRVASLRLPAYMHSVHILYNFIVYLFVCVSRSSGASSSLALTEQTFTHEILFIGSPYPYSVSVCVCLRFDFDCRSAHSCGMGSNRGCKWTSSMNNRLQFIFVFDSERESDIPKTIRILCGWWVIASSDFEFDRIGEDELTAELHFGWEICISNSIFSYVTWNWLVEWIASCDCVYEYWIRRIQKHSSGYGDWWGCREQEFIEKLIFLFSLFLPHTGDAAQSVYEYKCIVLRRRKAWVPRCEQRKKIAEKTKQSIKGKKYLRKMKCK